MWLKKCCYIYFTLYVFNHRNLYKWVMLNLNNMSGIYYVKSGGTIILKPKIQGKEIELFTPIRIMQAVIEGKRSYGHFNPKSDFKPRDNIKFKRNNAVKGDDLSG